MLIRTCLFMYNISGEIMFYTKLIKGKKIVKSDNLEYLEHFFTTRETCIKSKEPDDENIINNNKQTLCEYLNVKELISPQQTHSDNIEYAEIGKSDYPDTDALILTNNKQAVFLNFADCTPVILYDRIQNIGAIAHAGWRGTAKSIAVKTIQKMNSNPENIIAVIGPAICENCYNVGEEVFNQLKSTINDYDCLYKEKNGEIYVNLKGINAQQLRELGVKTIDICPYCTSCDNDLFFSYRKENGTTCRHSAVIKLKY